MVNSINISDDDNDKVKFIKKLLCILGIELNVLAKIT